MLRIASWAATRTLNSESAGSDCIAFKVSRPPTSLRMTQALRRISLSGFVSRFDQCEVQRPSTSSLRASAT